MGDIILENNIIELFNNMSIKRCPVCNCSRLWFREYIYISKFKYNVIFKCDNCAYVNTTLLNISKVSRYLIPISADYYRYNIYMCTDGRNKKANYYIGYNYWFEKNKIKDKNISCPICKNKLKIYDLKPFKRFDGYRIDVHCKCKSDHDILFGVHVPEEIYKKFKVEKSTKNLNKI